MIIVIPLVYQTCLVHSGRALNRCCMNECNGLEPMAYEGKIDLFFFSTWKLLLSREVFPSLHS